ncbi:hypothetical protein ACTWQB_11510 [Piscibacillus sp. B03]|uniref:hypothetical protein n=1 Tax=Piscibacillus sp. B03 TaxID=3457430 RepID=UPI003FCD7DC5
MSKGKPLISFFIKKNQDISSFGIKITRGIIIFVNKRKDDLVILNDNEIDLTYTSEMEKAMHQSHGVGYTEYGQKLEKRLQIEKEREKNYRESRRLVSEVDRQIHR